MRWTRAPPAQTMPRDDDRRMRYTPLGEVDLACCASQIMRCERHRLEFSAVCLQWCVDACFSSLPRRYCTSQRCLETKTLCHVCPHSVGSIIRLSVYPFIRLSAGAGHYCSYLALCKLNVTASHDSLTGWHEFTLGRDGVCAVAARYGQLLRNHPAAKSIGHSGGHICRGRSSPVRCQKQRTQPRQVLHTPLIDTLAHLAPRATVISDVLPECLALADHYLNSTVKSFPNLHHPRQVLPLQ